MLLLHYDFVFVEPGPLPPHERTWRHPSEVAAEEHAILRAETAPTTSRFLAMATGTLGLVAVGLLMLAVTPRPAESPIAISVTTTPTGQPGAGGTAPAGPTDAAPRAPHISAARGALGAIGLRNGSHPLATPVGDGRFAVVTAADVATGIGETVQVRLPSGDIADAEVTHRTSDAVLVELAVAVPGVVLASVRPAGNDVVTVMAEPPVTIVLDDLGRLEVDEGTAVLDDEGHLIGVCSQALEREGIRLVEISVDLADATSDG